ncbi:MAG: hypothetical protein V1704_00770 [Candidatus Vogelbacteria bacterium]
MDRKTIKVIVVFVILLGVASYFVFTKKQLIDTSSSGIRAGLDFRVEVSDQGVTKTVDCDFCSYHINNETYFQSQAVVAKGDYVDMIFLKKSEARREAELKINYQNILSSNEQNFSVGYYQVFRIKKGQNVSLTEKNISIRLIDVTGLGCPPGARC